MKSIAIKNAILAGSLVLVGLAGGCGPGADSGSAAVQLTFRAPQPRGLRAGVLEGVVDTVRITVSHQGQQLASNDFAYGNLSGVVTDIPAGTDRLFRAEALGGGTTVYAGEQPGVEILAGQQVQVRIDMAPAYQADIYPPAPIGDLSAQASGDSIQLNWTSSGDDWLVGTAQSYDLRRSDATIQEGTFDAATPISGVPAPAASGQAESFAVTGLEPGTYHFAIKVTDDDGNVSAISNEAIATVGSDDTTPPSDVLDLQVVSASVTATSLMLQWHAPGDDGSVGQASQYDLRYSDQPIDEANFDSATRYSTGVPTPAMAGSLESVQVTGLLPNTTYHFALKTADEVPNWSLVSNPASATTLPDDITPPAAISDLAAGVTTDTTVALSWTASGDDGNTGTAAQYDLRYATAPIANDTDFDNATQVTGVPAPQASGSAESFTVTGLLPSTTYYFAIKVGDEVPNWSALSNSPSAATQASADVTPPADISDLAAGTVTEDSVQLTWTASGDDGNSGTAALYDLRYSTSAITNDTEFNAATQVPGVPAPQAAGSSESFTVTGLSSGTTYYFGLKVRDEANNWSGLATTSTTTVADITAPAAATLTVGTVTENSVELTWTAPGDDDTTGTAAQYDLRYSTAAITNDTDFANATPVAGVPAPQAAGSAESFTVTGLSPATTYYFALKTADEVPNWSALSNSPSATTTTPDTTAPDAVTLTVGTITESSVQLTWTAPGDDGATGTAAQYDLRYSTAAIANDTDFANATQVGGVPAPQAAGSAESFTVTGLSPATTYYFALKTADEVPNWSGLSNSPSATTQASSDTTPPDPVTLAVGVVTESSVELTWNAPGDDGVTGTAAQYDLRYSTSAITNDTEFNAATQVGGVPAPQAAGSAESFTVTGLSPATTYYFALKTADEVSNWSGLSNSPSATTQAAADSTAPAAVTDLATGTVTENSIALTWTAPGDDGVTGTAAQYDLRYSTSAIANDTDFANATQVAGVPAPQAAGSSESFTVSGLNPDTTYYFAIKTADEVPNWSGLSNSPSATTQAAADSTAPAAVTNLATGTVTETTIELTWTAPGDDGATGTAAQYDLRYSTAAIVDDTDFSNATQVAGVPAPQAAGSSESFTVSGLNPDTTYYFAIKTADEVPNWSGLSNSPSATTQAAADSTPPAAVADLAPGTVTADSVELTWTAPGDDGATGTAAQYDLRYSTSPIANDTDFNAATQVAGVPTPSIAGSSESFTVSGLSASTTYYFAIKTADEVPNWSSLSNVATADTSGSGSDTTPPAAINTLQTGMIGFGSVGLTWQAPGDDGNVGQATTYDIRYSTTPITDDASFNAATQATGEPSPGTPGTVESFNVTGLTGGQLYYFAIKTADEVPNWSALSNVVQATPQ